MAPSAATYPRTLRTRLDLPATLGLAGFQPVAVQVIDLSQRGGFVETDLTAPPGTAASLRLELPEGPLSVEAVVARVGTALREAPHPDLDALVVRARGLGLRFVSLCDQERQRLERHLIAEREGEA